MMMARDIIMRDKIRLILFLARLRAISLCRYAAACLRALLHADRYTTRRHQDSTIYEHDVTTLLLSKIR